MINKDKQSRTSFLTIMIISLSIGGVFYYVSSIQNSLWNWAVSEILEITSQSKHAFEVHIERDMQLLDRMVKLLSQTKTGEHATINKIISLFDDYETDFIVVDLENRKIYDGSDEEIRSISDEELAFYESFEESDYREPYIEEYTGHEVIGGYLRFVFADGGRGIIQVHRYLSSVAGKFLLSFYNNTGFSYITNKQGEILMRSSHKNSYHSFNNILEALKSSDNRAGEIKILQDRMVQRREGVMRFTLEQENTILAFTPINGTSGWYLIAIVPDIVVMEHASEILKSSQTFMILIGGIIAVAVLFIRMNKQSQKKIKEKEGDVQYREQLFSILANNTNDVFLMFIPDDYSVEYISPNIERVLGLTPEEIKENIRLLERDSPDTAEEFKMIKNLKTEEFVIQEGERIHRKNGNIRWFEEMIYKTSVNDSERFVVVLSDRTEERKSRQALKEALAIAETANESKSVFLSNMSHDIRTPMNAIVGFSALLQRDAKNPEKVYEYTKKITASSQHLLGLINDVLDMSKIESGKTTLNISEISLAEIIDELATMMQPQAKAKHQEFKMDVYDVCNEEFLGDRLRINQILINILSNAVKYTPEGGKIEMIVRQLPQHKKNYAHFHFVIRDNGIGMSKEYLETIFHPFTRETSSKTFGIQGTGLGMAITKNLVDLMGGIIKVESEPDKGSTFTLELELRIKELDSDPDFWKDHGISRLLVADDEEEICLGIKNVMAGTGVNLEYALGGKDAVMKAENAQNEEQGFDMVLIDWQMPDISGIETARRIRRIVPASVPVVILTAYDIGRIEEEGAAAGIDGFLQKPFFLSNFKLLVDNLKAGEREEKAVEEKKDDILKGKHILAAEDNELNAEILLELLEMSDISCDLVNNGKEAAETFEQSDPDQYDLILMDVQMPVMNGYEATKLIRSCSHLQAKTVPIVAMTANAFSEDVKAALDSGMNAHVSKPIDMDLLKSVIKEVISQRITV